jgi:hypothetical protein
MALPPIGTRITALFTDARTWFGVVVKHLDAGRFAFAGYVLGYGRVGGPTFVLHAEDEGVVWSCGILHRWWPPHRRALRAMHAAEALAPGHGISMHKTAEQNESAEFKKSFDALMGNAEKIIQDFEKTLGNLPGTTRTTTVTTYTGSRRFRR